jgi:hypothetical protein
MIFAIFYFHKLYELLLFMAIIQLMGKFCEFAQYQQNHRHVAGGFDGLKTIPSSRDCFLK